MRCMRSTVATSWRDGTVWFVEQTSSTAPAGAQRSAFAPVEVAGLLAAGVAPRQVRQILERFAGLDAYLGADEAQRDGLPRQEPQEVDLAAADWAVVLGDEGYPPALAASPLPPPILFGRGDPAALRLGIAVVGTRSMTRLGEIVARTAVATAARLQIPVHSGGALGVDACAHRAALEEATPTVAVVAGGLDRLSPRGHLALFEQICGAGGAVVTEALPGTEVTPQRLQARNRIPVGLAAAVVVAEASLRSGTMGAALAAVSADRAILVASPRPGARQQPGAEAVVALANRRGIDPARLGLRGQLAAAVAARAPLADGVAADRDELDGLIEMAWLFSPHRQVIREGSPAGAVDSSAHGPAAVPTEMPQRRVRSA